jgi:hypothetical protein
MPKGRVVYVPASAPGRLAYRGYEIPVGRHDVAEDARAPGTRVRSEVVWDEGDLRARNVRRIRRALTPANRSER